MAKPKTGRTHQIRIHLRYAGYPIANDPCYGGIVYNDLKEFQNPDMLKFQQYIPEETKDELALLNDEGSKEKSQTKIQIASEQVLSVSEIYCYKIWLHAWNYKFEEYNFETKYPEWANKEYKIEHKF
jgi:23S rRNA-/tRNA-specific pseudouridylate synthase